MFSVHNISGISCSALQTVLVRVVTRLSKASRDSIEQYQLYRPISQETRLHIASYLASAQELMYIPNSQWQQSYKESRTSCNL
jgi:hypothetical protein